MPAKYNVIPRKNMNDSEAPPKYYPSFVTSGRVTLRQLSQQIAEISTVSSPDTAAVLEALLSLIPRELSNGNIVELGDFGSFILRINSEGSETANEVTSRNITRVTAKFRPSKEFAQALQKTTFTKNGS